MPTLRPPRADRKTTRPPSVRALWGSAIVLGGPLLLALCAACQSYSPAPLEPDRHLAAWWERGPASLPEGDANDGLTLEQGRALARAFHPRLRLARLQAAVATAGAEHAGRWNDPELDFDLLRIAESVSDPWVAVAGLGIPFSLSGRPGVERDQARAEERAALRRVDEVGWEVRLELEQAWFRWTGLAARVERTEASLAGLELLEQRTARLAELGELSRPEASLFALERAGRAAQLARACAGSWPRPRSSSRWPWGWPPGTPLAPVPAWGTAPASDLDASTRDQAARIEARHPSLARLRAEYAVAEETLRLQITRRGPDPVLGPSAESDQGQWRIGLGGVIPLPVFRANRRAIAEAAARREVARGELELELEQLVGRWAVARERARSLAAERERLERVLVPLTDDQVDAAAELLRLGESGALVLLENLSRQHDAHLGLLGVRTEQAQILAELRHLTGPDGQDDSEGNQP